MHRGRHSRVPGSVALDPPAVEDSAAGATHVLPLNHLKCRTSAGASLQKRSFAQNPLQPPDKHHWKRSFGAYRENSFATHWRAAGGQPRDACGGGRSREPVAGFRRLHAGALYIPVFTSRNAARTSIWRSAGLPYSETWTAKTYRGSFSSKRARPVIRTG